MNYHNLHILLKLSAPLAARSVLPINRPATPLFSPAFWELGFQAWACQKLKKKNLLPKITAKSREMKRKKKEFSCNEWSVIFSYWSHLVGFYSWLLPSSLCNFRHIPSLWKKKNTSHHFSFASSLRSKWILRPTRDEHGIQIWERSWWFPSQKSQAASPISLWSCTHSTWKVL